METFYWVINCIEFKPLFSILLQEGQKEKKGGIELQDYFSMFSFRAVWTPELLIILILFIFLYYRLVYSKARAEHIESPKTKRLVYFGAALAAMYFGWGGPLYTAGHSIMTFHMAQMVLVYFIAVPLFILSIPPEVWEKILQRFQGWPARIAAHVFHPVTALLLFNAFFSIYHLPAVFDYLMQAPLYHDLYQWLLFGSAFLMWWYMLAPVPTTNQLSELKRIAYIFGNGILITPACALIIFAGSPMYETYTNAAVWSNVMAYCLPAGSELPAGLSGTAGGGLQFMQPHTDQQLAGVMMKVLQEFVYVSTIGFVFKQWLSREKQQDGELSISDIPVHPQK